MENPKALIGAHPVAAVAVSFVAGMLFVLIVGKMLAKKAPPPAS
jgi:hypothetical protein